LVVLVSRTSRRRKQEESWELAMPRWGDADEGAAADEAIAAAAAVRLANKIRKRRAVSSSGGSDPAAGRRLRSRRPAVLLPRRRTSAGGDMSESSRGRHCRGGGTRLADGTWPSASARRLVDAFWQDMDSDLLEGDAAAAAAARRSLVQWSGASTEVGALILMLCCPNWRPCCVVGWSID
jgi:hypothetical protein